MLVMIAQNQTINQKVKVQQVYNHHFNYLLKISENFDYFVLSIHLAWLLIDNMTTIHLARNIVNLKT